MKINYQEKSMLMFLSLYVPMLFHNSVLNRVYWYLIRHSKTSLGSLMVFFCLDLEILFDISVLIKHEWLRKIASH